MLSTNSSNSRRAFVALTMGLITAFAIPASGQAPQTVHVGNLELKGLPDDWTHHHLVFHDPGTAEDALRNGKYDEWFRIVNDPRYVMQQMKRDQPASGSAADDVARFEEARRDARERDRDRWQFDGHKTSGQPAINKDWSMALGGSGTKVGAGMFPAKYNFSTTAAVNCASAATPDFVVYNTSVAGSTTQASVVAYDNLYSGCTGQVPSVYWAFNTGGTAVTSVVLSYSGAQLAFMQTPSSGSAQLVLLTWKAAPTGHTLTSGTTNIANGSKNFTTTTGLTAMDVGAVITGTGIPTGDSIATVTSTTAGTLTNQATGNGTSGESLVISANPGHPDTLTSVGAGSYYGCMAPCMVTLPLTGTGTRTDTVSSPYYDYNSDTLYVGDASGGLHKFHPVFNGTPAEIISGSAPWVTLGTTAVTSPVYDSTTGNVFAGDASGYVYSVNASGGVTKSFQVAVSPGIVDGPLIDSTNHQLYVIASTDTNASNTGSESTCAPSGNVYETCNGIINLPTTFTATTKFLESVIGVSPANTLYDGAFDNLYWTTGTGNLYSVGGNGNNEPKLMETPITTAGIANTSIACANSGGLPNCSDLRCANNIDNPVTNAAAAGSPVTEILNGSTDYIFASVTASGNLTHCSGACLYSWNVASKLGSGAAPLAGGNVTGGTSGIIIDNTDGTTGASEIYFSTLANATCTTSGNVGATNTGCAIQAAQSAP